MCTPKKTSQSITHPKIASGQACITLKFFVGGVLEKNVYLGSINILSILLTLEPLCHNKFHHIYQVSYKKKHGKAKYCIFDELK
jgi:hypothetical protein